MKAKNNRIERNKIMFNQMNQNTQGMEEVKEKDSLGGNLKNTGLYDAVIDLAYTTKADSGALGFAVVFKFEDGSTHRLQEWITSGDTKGNKPYYERDGKKIPLPGFTKISAITEMLMGKPLADFTDSDAETKTIKLWDGKQSKEVPTDVPMITALLGKKVKLGLLQVRTNKQEKQNGKYVNTAEDRTLNEADKVFNENGFTLQEIEANFDEPDFINKWKEKYGTKLVDRYKEIKGGASNTNKSSMFGDKGGQQSKPANSLFSKPDDSDSASE